MPNLFVIAGPNGAGKTTYARRFLPQEMRCHEFVNADLIAAGLSPFNPASAEFEAGRIMVRRLQALAAARADFSFGGSSITPAPSPFSWSRRRTGCCGWRMRRSLRRWNLKLACA